MATPVTSELFATVLERISNGETLRACARDLGFAESSLRKFAMDDPIRDAQYIRAREMQVEAMADEIIELSDESAHDTTTRADGSECADNEWISRSRLRVDTRKWLMSKLFPRRYGDKVEQHTTVEVGDKLATLLDRVRARRNG